MPFGNQFKSVRTPRIEQEFDPMPSEKSPSPNELAAKPLGEHEIINLMRRHLTPMPNIAVGFGDDVTAVDLGADGEVAVLKTDMLVAKTDVPDGMTLWQAARKAVIMNVSDFAAKGAQPQVALVSLGLPRSLSPEGLAAIADGLDAGAREYNCFVVGGDTGEACDLIIAVELFGVAQKGKLMLRGGAQPGDVLAVTGLFGLQTAGLLLRQNRGFVASIELSRELLDSVYMPHARLAEGLALSGSGAVSASIDSSDGLAWCLHELSEQGRVGFEVSDLPLAAEAEEFAHLNGLETTDLALYGGEEYELVLTVKPDLWRKAAAAVNAVGGKLIPIGKTTADKHVLLDEGGKKREIVARGYEHFKD